VSEIICGMREKSQDEKVWKVHPQKDGRRTSSSIASRSLRLNPSLMPSIAYAASYLREKKHVRRVVKFTFVADVKKLVESLG